MAYNTIDNRPPTGRYLVVTKADHSYIVKYDEGEELRVLFTLIRFAETQDFNLVWNEIFFLINELCRKNFSDKAGPKLRQFGTMKYKVF